MSAGARSALRLRASVLVAALVAVALPLAARADGDPASDFLLSQSTFLSPFDGRVDPAQASRLVSMLAQAQQRGFALKVAVIVTPYDLGSVPILFRKPRTYARFLGEEDYYYWKDELVVVMPNGYGIYAARGLPPGDAATIARLRFTDTTNGTALVVAAQRAVEALAARRRIALAAGSGAGGGSSALDERLEIGGAIAALLLLGVAGRLARRRWSVRSP